jgi:hypothetical protein
MDVFTLVWFRTYDASNGTRQFSRTTLNIDLWAKKATLIEKSSFEYSRTRNLTIRSIERDGQQTSVNINNNIVVQLTDDGEYKEATVFKIAGDGEIEVENHFEKQLEPYFMLFTHCELFND